MRESGVNMILPVTPPELINSAALGDSHQPSARVVRDTGFRPLRQRGYKRVLRKILGQPHISYDPDQPGDQPC
jgi:hypothetical protein